MKTNTDDDCQQILFILQMNKLSDSSRFGKEKQKKQTHAAYCAAFLSPGITREYKFIIENNDIGMKLNRVDLNCTKMGSFVLL